MIPMLGAYALDQWHTSATEKQSYEKGRWHRRIVIRGAADHFANSAAVHQALDALSGAALTPEPVLLRLRPGRAVPVRLHAIERTCLEPAFAAEFTLALDALTPWEEADAPSVLETTVTGNGPMETLSSGGTLPSPLSFTFVADTPGMVWLPRFGDGTRTLLYEGMAPGGATLHIDGATRSVYLDDEDVTTQTSGAFPLLNPWPTTLSFEAEEDGIQTGALTLEWRKRWL